MKVTTKLFIVIIVLIIALIIMTYVESREGFAANSTAAMGITVSGVTPSRVYMYEIKYSNKTVRGRATAGKTGIVNIRTSEKLNKIGIYTIRIYDNATNSNIIDFEVRGVSASSKKVSLKIQNAWSPYVKVVATWL